MSEQEQRSELFSEENQKTILDIISRGNDVIIRRKCIKGIKRYEIVEQQMKVKGQIRIIVE